MKENTSSYVEVEEELSELKAYGLLAYALIKDISKGGSPNDGSADQAALIIQNNITALCERIENKLNSEE